MSVVFQAACEEQLVLVIACDNESVVKCARKAIRGAFDIQACSTWRDVRNFSCGLGHGVLWTPSREK